MSEWPQGTGGMAALIRSLDWAATPLGPTEGWSDRLKLMTEQVLASPIVSSLVCGAERVLIYNDAAATLYGDRHPQALGRPLPDTFPEGWATVAPFYERAFAGESVVVTGQPLDTRGEGDPEADRFDAYLAPVREAGAVAHVHMIGIEVGERERAQARLAESEANYRFLFDALDEGFCTIEVLFDGAGRAFDYRFLSVNSVFEQQTGLSSVVGRTIREMVPGHEARWFETFGRIALTGRAERFEEGAEALGRWYDVYAFRIGPPDRRQVAVLFNDILPRKRAEAILRASEDRQAFLLKLSDALRLMADARDIRATACRLLGTHLGASRAYYVEFLPREDCGVVADDFRVEGLASLAGRYPFETFRSTYERITDGATWVVPDVAADTELEARERAFYAAQGIIAWVDVPFGESGRSGSRVVRCPDDASALDRGRDRPHR